MKNTIDGKMVNPEKIIPVNTASEIGKVALLSASMREGWKGSPILVYEREPNVFKAITGSHRIAAARACGIDIPVYIVSGLEMYEDNNGDTIEDMRDDEEVLRFLRGYGEAEGVEIMEIEVENNKKEIRNAK